MPDMGLEHPTRAPLAPSPASWPDPASSVSDSAASQTASGEESELVDVDTWVRESPPWLFSAVLHMLALIALAVFLMAGEVVEEPLNLDATFAENLGEQLIEPELELDSLASLEIEQQMITPDDLPAVDDPLAMPELAELAPAGPLMASMNPAEVIGVSLTGREPGSKRQLLKKYGGTASTEEAVMEGLKWLARNQTSFGNWSLRGPYSDGGSSENEEAATAMALLAFQGAGFTPKGDRREPFTRVVSRGWNWLLKQQDDNGNFFHNGAPNHRFYTHAQCTIALCELYGMTREGKYREPAQRAIDYLEQTQSNSGGWRYEPRTSADLSVTGWCVMALQSARMAGLEVSSEKLLLVNEFLDKVARSGGSEYAYMIRDGAKPSMSAEGLLCRQYLGWKRDDPRLVNGVEKLLTRLPRWGRRRNVYYWYYATQVAHHMEGEPWETWNNEMRQVLPENQVPRGRERGSWAPSGDTHGGSGGRLYVTCLTIYCLEVYYRHLPIYSGGLLE